MRNTPDELIERSLDALDDVFYVYDAAGRLVHWNSHLNELTGRTDAELAGMVPEAFFVPEDRPRVRAAVEEVFETGDTVVEARHETPDGTALLQLSGRLITEGGEPVGFSGVGRDITNRDAREERLAAENERLEEFAAVVSHDLRNPLTVGMGRLELAREGIDPEANLEAVADAFERMEAIIEDALTAAREGAAAVETVPTALGECSRHAWASVDTDGATLTVVDSATVDADPERLQRLLENLFRNSVEHGGPSVHVRVEATETGFAVADDGPGIPESERERVFEAGFGDGTGFGLHIVRTLAESHGWTVHATTGENGGTRIAFETGDAPLKTI